MSTMSRHSEADLKRLTFGDDLVVDDVNLDEEDVRVGDNVRLTDELADRIAAETLDEVGRRDVQGHNR